jgi:uncharacterized RDD family membrane protein YckC
MRCPNCESQLSPYSKQCDRCGEDVYSGQYLVEESGVLDDEPAAPNKPSSTRASSNSNYKFASLGDRFVAFALDTAVLFGVFAVADAWAFMRWGNFENAELQLTVASLLIAVTLNVIILILYGWMLEAAWGATIGKIMVGIRVVGSEGRSFFWACARRNLLRIVDGFGFYIAGILVAACSSVRQRIGDAYAGTAVVEQSFGSKIRVVAAIVFLAILGASGWAVPRICSVDRSVHSHHLNQVVVRVGKTNNSAYVRVARFSVDVRTSVTQ